MSILSLISSDNFIAINKTLLKVLGIEATLLLGDLASQSNYWGKNSILEDGFFYSTAENIEERTTLSVYKQQQAIQKLEKLGLLETKLKGVPAKKYFKILEQPICEFLDSQFVKNSQTSLLEINKQDCEKLKGKKNITKNKRENIDISIKETTKEKKSMVETVLDEYPVFVNNPDLVKTYLDFAEMRKAKGKKYEIKTEGTVRSSVRSLLKLGGDNVRLIEAIINQSIERCWDGFFDVKDSNDYFGDELKRINSEKSLRDIDGQLKLSFTTPLSLPNNNHSGGMTEEEQKAFLKECGL